MDKEYVIVILEVDHNSYSLKPRVIGPFVNLEKTMTALGWYRDEINDSQIAMMVPLIGLGQSIKDSRSRKVFDSFDTIRKRQEKLACQNQGPF